jgi:hypothetical protein
MTASKIIKYSWPAWSTWSPKVRKSIVRAVRRQGAEKLEGIYETNEYVGLCFTNIMIGVEKLGHNEGYAHS